MRPQMGKGEVAKGFPLTRVECSAGLVPLHRCLVRLKASK
jgi:hypothetical protein